MTVDRRDYQGQIEHFCTTPVPLFTFLSALFAQPFMESIKGTCSNNQPSGPTFEESFEDAYIMFTHFVKTADDLSMIVLGKSFCKILSSQHNTAITDELECPEPGATFVPTRKQNLLGCFLWMKSTTSILQVRFQVVLVRTLQPFLEPSDK